jgi:hypothetical protein
MPHTTPLPSPQAWILQAKGARVAARVVRLFEGAEVPTLVVKGIATAHLLYADPAQRPVSDVDLRIPPFAFRRAQEVVERSGFSVRWHSKAYDNLVFDVEGVPVDLEAHIGPPGLCRLTVFDLLARARRLSIGGELVRIPETTDHALYSAVNLFKDKIEAASPWAREDFRRLVIAADFDGVAFVERAECASMGAIVATVLSYFVADDDATVSAIATGLLARLSPPNMTAQAHRAILAATRRAPTSLLARVVARAGSDDPRQWLGALRAAASFEREKRRAKSNE